jgi:hypothetical protein
MIRIWFCKGNLQWCRYMFLFNSWIICFWITKSYLLFSSLTFSFKLTTFAWKPLTKNMSYLIAQHDLSNNLCWIQLYYISKEIMKSSTAIFQMIELQVSQWHPLIICFYVRAYSWLKERSNTNFFALFDWHLECIRFHKCCFLMRRFI